MKSDRSAQQIWPDNNYSLLVYCMLPTKFFQTVVHAVANRIQSEVPSTLRLLINLSRCFFAFSIHLTVVNTSAPQFIIRSTVLLLYKRIICWR